MLAPIECWRRLGLPEVLKTTTSRRSDKQTPEQVGKKEEEVEEGEYDLFLYLGDFTDPDYAKELLDEVDATCLATTGNRDLHFEQELVESDYPVYDFLKADVDDEYTVVLIGGDYSSELAGDVRKILEQVDADTTVVGSHYPPERLGDQIETGDRVGREEFRRMILRYKPAAWCCGHIHEDYGHFELMDTDVLNASSFDSGKGYRVVLDENGEKQIDEIELLQ